MNKRESRNILIITLVVAVVAVCGSVLYSGIDFKGAGFASKNATKWKLDLTNISICTLSDQVRDNRCQAVYGDAENIDGETYIDSNDSLKAFFKTRLYKTEDSITYKVTVKNSGSLSAKVTSIRFDKDYNNPVIFTYNNLEEGEVLAPGESKVFYVMASFVGQSSNVTTFDNAINLTFALAE